VREEVVGNLLEVMVLRRGVAVVELLITKQTQQVATAQQVVSLFCYAKGPQYHKTFLEGEFYESSKH